jgi:DNA polymerase elongation subunit (family B)
MFQNIFITGYSDPVPSMVFLWDDQKGLQTIPYREFAYAYKKDEKGKFKSIHGDKLSKIKRFDWNESEDLFESDVPRETRVLTDLYLDSDDISTGHRVAFFDIEVRSTGGFATWQNPYQEITAISIYDQQNDRYYIFLLDPEQKVESKEDGNRFLVSCESEVELLEIFYEVYKTINPTILTGWNTDGYDIPYLYNRTGKVLGFDKANSLSPIGVVKWQQGRDCYKIAGVSSLDYIKLYKKFTYKQQPSYRLDAIGRLEVKRGKVEYEGTLDDLFRNDLQKFIEYNLTDVLIVVELDKKKNLIELVQRVCHVGHVPYEDFEYSSKFIEGTILTYLHRKHIIAPNKPAGGREAFEQKLETDTEGFIGAYVRPPYPGLYEWVYSLDLQSLYPSIIMSLNISPETKVGNVPGWDTEKHMKKEIAQYVINHLGTTYKFARQQFVDYLENNHLHISSNGVLYRTDRVGVIPEILDKWFGQRVEYKNLMKKYAREGDKKMETYYDQMQSVQKVFLNSIYGVLGLSIFRFYDLDNAAAVTLTGQDVIKTTAKYINNEYKKAGVLPKEDWWLTEYHKILIEDEEKKASQAKRPIQHVDRPTQDDHCIYIDTDSVYFSAEPLFQPAHDPKAQAIQIACETEAKVNKFYDTLAKVMFNCDTHRFFIKGESIMATGFWVAKKRYALKKLYDLEKNLDDDNGGAPVVKGMDVIRSTFPPAFQRTMKAILWDILNKEEKAVVDKKVLAFFKEMKTLPVVEIARNTGIKEISKYEDATDDTLSSFPKGAPIHVKASITYNRLLRIWGKDTLHAPIRDGDKIKYVFLKPNPYRISTVAFKNYDDPDEVVELINDYIDHKTLFESEMAKKLDTFYDALKWGLIPTKINQGSKFLVQA